MNCQAEKSTSLQTYDARGILRSFLAGQKATKNANMYFLELTSFQKIYG